MHQRLYAITLLLTQRGGATADELAARFSVSRRTIYRDLDALSSAGVPVYAQPGKGGGIRMLPGYTIDKAMFSKEEQADLLADMGSLASLGAPGAEALLDKLAAVFGRQDNWLEVDFAPWGAGPELRAGFGLLRSAILQRRVLGFGYSGATASPGPRSVEPARVVFRGQGWYLYAWCRSRKAWRYFKLSRMRDITLGEERFSPRTPPPAEAPAAGPTMRVRLRFSPEAAFRVLDEFSPAQLSPAPGGGYIAEADFPWGDGWLPGYILSFGAAAEVLHPPELREKVAATLAEMLGQYAE